MNKFMVVLALSAGISGCATRTKYGPHTQSGGYSETRLDDKIMLVRFSGNALTNSRDALMYSKFRATEFCFEKGFKTLRIYETKDLTTSQTVQKTSHYNYQQPTYFSGSSTSNTNMFGGNGYASGNTSSDFSGTMYGGGSQGGATSWKETYHYPTYDTIFSCTNQAYLLKVKPKDISPEDMKPFVKDLMGGVQIEEVMEGSPNRGILQTGDIVIKVNGSRVRNRIQMISEVDVSKDKNKIELVIFRDGVQKAANAVATDGTDMIVEANKELANAVCKVSEVKARPICADRSPASK